MSTPELASLTRWLGELQRQVRDLATGNPLNKGSVQNAEGRFVPISALAFGQVIDIWEGLDVIELTGPVGSVGYTAWQLARPEVDVLVTGGRLRIDLAANLTVTGDRCQMQMGFSLTRTGPPEAPGSESVELRAPSSYESLMVSSPQGNLNTFGGGTWSLITGLAPGWYRVQSAYRLFHSALTTTDLPPGGAADYPRLAATPF